jgi:anti-sigma B factor antagonist
MVAGWHDVCDRSRHRKVRQKAMARFEATTSDGDGRVRVALTGECDLSVSEQLTTTLLDAVRRAPLVVVDMAQLDFLDSSGVHGLITAHHAARDSGRRLVLVNPTGTVATVLDITGVAGLLSPSAADGDGGLLSPSAADGDGDRG